MEKSRKIDLLIMIITVSVVFLNVYVLRKTYELKERISVVQQNISLFGEQCYIHRVYFDKDVVMVTDVSENLKITSLKCDKGKWVPLQ